MSAQMRGSGRPEANSDSASKGSAINCSARCMNESALVHGSCCPSTTTMRRMVRAKVLCVICSVYSARRENSFVSRFKVEATGQSDGGNHSYRAGQCLSLVRLSGPWLFSDREQDGGLRDAREPRAWFATCPSIRLPLRLLGVGVISERPFGSLLFLYGALGVRLNLCGAAYRPCLVPGPLDARLGTRFCKTGLGCTVLMPRDLSAYDTDTLRNKGGHSNVTYWRYRPSAPE
jgi:hypothetical protein